MDSVYLLYKINTWWKTGEVDSLYLHKRIRSEFSDIVKSLCQNSITNIEGPTGAGKSALMYQTVGYLLKLGVQPKRIFMFGGNDFFLFGEHHSIGGVLEAYSAGVLHENIYSLKSQVYIFIDDIQFIDDWQIYLMNYIAKGVRIKFIISETLSASSFSEKSLPPEINERVTVMPLTQRQYFDLYCAYRENDFDLIKFKSVVPPFPVYKDPAGYCDALIENYILLSGMKPFVMKMAGDYFLYGGYPACFNYKNPAEWQIELMHTIERTIYRDIPTAMNIKAPQKIPKLLCIIAAYGGKEQSFGNIGRMLYMDTATIINYISGLCSGGLAAVFENYVNDTPADGHVVRKNKRMYVLDPGVRNTVLKITENSEGFGENLLNAGIFSAFSYARESGGKIRFWKDGRHEAEIVVDGGTPLPVSVEYCGPVSEKRIKGLKCFIRNTGARNALVITKDTLKREGSICYVPFWLI